MIDMLYRFVFSIGARFTVTTVQNLNSNFSIEFMIKRFHNFSIGSSTKVFLYFISKIVVFLKAQEILHKPIVYMITKFPLISPLLSIKVCCVDRLLDFIIADISNEPDTSKTANYVLFPLRYFV